MQSEESSAKRVVTPSQIAAHALQHYKTLPKKGKPQSHEWTVYATIVATVAGETVPWVVSCATGTKCACPPSKELAGLVLHDSHAEVLARRGLLRLLWNEIIAQREEVSAQRKFIRQNPQRLLDFDGDTFKLREALQLHLYITDSPCGDASIYELNDDQGLNFTGAKVIVSKETGVKADDCGGSHQILKLKTSTDGAFKEDGPIEGARTTIARENVQIFGALRTKSGRSNLADHLRSQSMSCSDKIVRWSILGLQGALLSRYISEPIRFSSICVSRDPRVQTDAQLNALKRAITCRVQNAFETIQNALHESNQSLQNSFLTDAIDKLPQSIPCVHIVEELYSQGKANVATAKRGQNEQTSCTSTTTKEPSCRKRQLEPTEARSCKKPRKDKSPFSPCGTSINWHQPLYPSTADDKVSVEITVGARGTKQGKKPKSLSDYRAHASRLSRYELVSLAMSCNSDESTTYQEKKIHSLPEEWQWIRDMLLNSASSPLVGWLTDSDSGSFPLPEVSPIIGSHLST